MGISSAMSAGVSGLNANANKLATISDNIANSQTFGYKRADTDFASMAINENVRSYTAGAGQLSADGAKLSEVLDSLEGRYPGIRGRIVDESGALRRFVNVYVGDDDVRFVGGLDAEVPEGTRISIIPAVAGG